MKKFIAIAFYLLLGVVLSPVYGQQVKEQVNLTFNNGVRFVGEYSYLPMTAPWPPKMYEQYDGTLYYPNGDTETGVFNTNWQPANGYYNTYHRASDNKDFVKHYDINGNLEFVEKENPATSSGSGEVIYTPTPQTQPQIETCRVCSGTGKCSFCYGTGIGQKHAPGIVVQCGACGGTGRCSTCRGQGHH